LNFVSPTSGLAAISLTAEDAEVAEGKRRNHRWTQIYTDEEKAEGKRRKP
jgi:hypothetical protein